MKKLDQLNDWGGNSSDYRAKRSAQSYQSGPQAAMAAGGSACGAGDDGKKNPTPKP